MILELATAQAVKAEMSKCKNLSRNGPLVWFSFIIRNSHLYIVT